MTPPTIHRREKGEPTMDASKYHPGQVVYFTAAAVKGGAPVSAHRIERILPADSGEQRYRVKAMESGRERAVGEDQLSARITVEALAQSLYEQSNTTNIPWARRDRTVRDAWVAKAFTTLVSNPTSPGL
jgi:hypothetical protein